jgi:type IV secretory pathway protease TraF
MIKTFVTFIFGVYAIIFILSGQIFINMTPSNPLGIWLKSPVVEGVGEYVVFCPRRDQLAKFPEYNHFNVQTNGRCDGFLSPMLKRIEWIKEDKIYVVGDRDRSYDSRVFGAIDKNQIVTVVKPFLTWKGSDR